MKAQQLKTYIKKLVKEAVREELLSLLEEDIKKEEERRAAAPTRSISEQLNGIEGGPRRTAQTHTRPAIDPSNPFAAAIQQTMQELRPGELHQFAGADPVPAPNLSMPSHTPPGASRQQEGPVMIEQVYANPAQPAAAPAGLGGIDFMAKLKAMEEAQKRRHGG